MLSVVQESGVLALNNSVFPITSYGQLDSSIRKKKLFDLWDYATILPIFKIFNEICFFPTMHIFQYSFQIKNWLNYTHFLLSLQYISRKDGFLSVRYDFKYSFAFSSKTMVLQVFLFCHNLVWFYVLQAPRSMMNFFFFFFKELSNF